MLTFSDSDFRDKMEDEAGERPRWESGAFGDLEADVRKGIAAIKDSPFVPNKDSVRGFVYDVKTGKLNEVS
jgi:carbonic anhydrase